MQSSPEIEAVIRSWFDHVARGDASWLDRHLSSDPRLRIVGTDPEEWLLGEAASGLLRQDLAALGGNVSIEVHDAEGYSEGDVGWGVARFTIDLGSTKISPRWSGVFHREAGDWKAVQVHASIGLTNEQAFGMSFN